MFYVCVRKIEFTIHVEKTPMHSILYSTIDEDHCFPILSMLYVYGRMLKKTVRKSHPNKIYVEKVKRFLCKSIVPYRFSNKEPFFFTFLLHFEQTSQCSIQFNWWHPRRHTHMLLLLLFLDFLPLFFQDSICEIC